MEKVDKDCIKSLEEFNKHYEGCPYSHTPLEVPEDVKQVLGLQTVDSSLTQMTLEEKKAKIKEMILAKKPTVPGQQSFNY